jgi:mannose-6-phosphate isomerase-like protein (cupin superfamily)
MRLIACICECLLGALPAGCKSLTQYPRNARIVLVAFFCLAIVSNGASAQVSGSVYTEQRAIEIAKHLREQMNEPGKAVDGIAEERLDDATQVAVRIKSGRGELHQKADDVFFVISGTATLVSGGKIVNPKGDLEVRGDSVQGGTRILLHKGDVVHIQHSVPHQLLIDPGKTFTYVVVKIPR